MTCRDFRRLADAFLSAQTTAQTNHDILRHLQGCSSCGADLEGRRQLRTALRGAFNGAPALAPAADFTARLRTHLREEVDRARPGAISRRAWLGLAAGFVLTIGLTGRLVTDRETASADALARDAIGDHRNCALKYRLTRMPVPLPEAAAQFDDAYRLLMTAPPDEMSAPGGAIRVLERHACAYDGRRFGHVIMQYRGHTVSLLMTSGRGRVGPVVADAMPHPIGQPAKGLAVVAVDASDRSILLVGDLGDAELIELSKIVARPLARRLAGGRPPSADMVVAAARRNALSRMAVPE